MNEDLKKLSFTKAKKRVPEGILKLVEIRSDLDQVSYSYAEDYIYRRYEFYLDSKGRVLVITDRPEEPGVWIPEMNIWMSESDADEEIVRDE